MVTGSAGGGRVDVAQVEVAIRAAEQRTSGQVRVGLSRFYVRGDVLRAAERVFTHLQMHRTQERNGVLIFVEPWRRRFAIVGDAGIHERVDSACWNEIADVLRPSFQAGDLTGGLERGIARIGELLAEHFPAARHAEAKPALARRVVTTSPPDGGST